MQPVAVITGAASGIGFALAQVCSQRGMHVVMADNAATVLCDKVEQLAGKNHSEVFGVVCDVTNLESVKFLAKQCFDRFNRIDWLFNNAGVSGHLAPIWELTAEHVRKVIDVNLYGVIYGVQTFLPFMFQQSHRSHIINLASLYGLCSGSQMSAYAMSKHALVALSESLYFDLERLNKPVDVSVVCPSFVNTRLLVNSKPAHVNYLHNMVADLIAHGRSADELAEYIVRAVEDKVFYILPDKEVKNYLQQRIESIIAQKEPYKHDLERLIVSLSKRAQELHSD